MIAAVRMGAHRYTEISSDDPGRATSVIAAVGRGLAVPAATVCLGALVTAVLLTPRRGADRGSVEEFGTMSLVRGAGVVWATVAAALIVIDAADGNGQPLGSVFAPGGGLLIVNGYLPRAWIVVVCCAVVVLLTATLSRAWTSVAACLPVAAVGVLAPVVVGHVLVGPDHDFAGDATIVAAPFAAAMLGSTLVLFVGSARAHPSAALLRRYLRLCRVAWPVTVAGELVVAAVETQGAPRLGSATGQLFAVQFALLLVLLVLLLRLRRVVAAGGGGGSGPGGTAVVRLLAAASVVTGGYLGVDVALTRIPPPQFFVPTSIAQNFLGYDVSAAPDAAVLALHWRVNLLFLTLAAAGIGGYLAGVRRLRRAGRPWPATRTAAWIAGWTVAVVTTSSGVGRYAGASFSVHMILHMSLNMIVPALLVLGGPITVIRAAWPGRPRSAPAGLHEWVTDTVGSGPLRHVCHPLHALIAYTASYYLLYFTDIFDQASRYHWAHEVMNLEFLAVGYLYFWLIIGVDRPPRPVPQIGRLGLILAGMPFHAFFGVLVMTRRAVIAQVFYEYLASQTTWITDLPHDQYVGGGIALAVGEVPLTFALVVLLRRWARADRLLEAGGRPGAAGLPAADALSDRDLDLDLGPGSGSGSGSGGVGGDAYGELVARLARRGAGDRPEGGR